MSADADRNAAEYVISLGGAVYINGKQDEPKDAKNLPAEPFRLTGVHIVLTNKITADGLACFQICKNLTYLYLFDIHLTDAGLAHFAGCRDLVSLVLQQNPKVTDAGLARFRDCKKLTTLDLYLTSVTDIGLEHFKDCRDLELISLGNTKVTDAGLKNFVDCPKLKQLHLWLAKEVTNAGLELFKGHSDGRGREKSASRPAELQGDERLRREEAR